MWGSFFYPHTVTVEQLTASGGMGSAWGDPVDLAAEVKDEQRLVRNPSNEEVVSSTQVTVALPADVPVGSRVTVWGGTTAQRRSTVLAVRRDENSPPLDSFLVLSLE